MAFKLSSGNSWANFPSPEDRGYREGRFQSHLEKDVAIPVLVGSLAGFQPCC